MSFNRPLTGQSQIYATVALNTNVCANSVSTVYLSATNASFVNITTNTWTAGNVSTPNVIATDGYFSNLYISTQTVSTLNACSSNFSNVYASNASITNLSTTNLSNASTISTSTFRAYITNVSTQNSCLVATSTVYSSYSFLDTASVTTLSCSNIHSSSIVVDSSIDVDGDINGITGQFQYLEVKNSGGNVVYSIENTGSKIVHLIENSGVPSIDFSRLGVSMLSLANTCSIFYTSVYTSRPIYTSSINASNGSVSTLNTCIFYAENASANNMSLTTATLGYRLYYKQGTGSTLYETYGDVAPKSIYYNILNSGITQQRFQYLDQDLMTISTSRIMAYQPIYCSTGNFSLLNISSININSLTSTSINASNLSVSSLSVNNTLSCSVGNFSLVNASTISLTSVSSTSITTNTLYASNIYGVSYISSQDPLSIRNSGVIIRDKNTSGTAYLALNYDSSSFGGEVYGMILEADQTSGAVLTAGYEMPLTITLDGVSQLYNTCAGGFRFYNTINNSFATNLSRLNSTSMFVSNISVSNISISNTLYVSNISVSNFSGINMSVSGRISVSNISSTAISATGQISASNIRGTYDIISEWNLSGVNIYGSGVNCSNVFVSVQVNTSQVSCRSISSASTYTSWASASNASITNASLTTATITTATGTTINSTTFNGSTMNASTLAVSTFLPTSITTTNLSATNASFQGVNVYSGANQVGAITKVGTNEFALQSTLAGASMMTFYVGSNLKGKISTSQVLFLNPLYVSTGNFSNLNASNFNPATITTTTLSASTLNASNLNVSTFNPESLSTSTINASTGNICNISAITITSVSVYASQIYVSGATTQTRVLSTGIEAPSLNVSVDGNINYLTAVNGTVQQEFIIQDQLTFRTGTGPGTLEADVKRNSSYITFRNFPSLCNGFAFADNVGVNYASFNGSDHLVTMEKLNTTTGNFSTLSASNVNFSTINTCSSNICNISTSYISGYNLTANIATIGALYPNILTMKSNYDTPSIAFSTSTYGAGGSIGYDFPNLTAEYSVYPYNISYFNLNAPIMNVCVSAINICDVNGSLIGGMDMNACRFYISNISCSSLGVSTINNTSLFTTNISVSSISTSTLTNVSATLNRINNTSLFTTNISVASLSTSNITTTGRITTSNLTVVNSSTTNASASALSVSYLNATNISTTSISGNTSIITIHCSQINTCANINASNVSAPNISTDNLSVSNELTSLFMTCSGTIQTDYIVSASGIDCNFITNTCWLNTSYINNSIGISDPSLPLTIYSVSNTCGTGLKVPRYLDTQDSGGMIIGANITSGYINVCRGLRMYANILTDDGINTLSADGSIGIGGNLGIGNLTLGNTGMTGNISVDTTGSMVFGCDRRSTWNTSDLVKCSTQLGSHYVYTTSSNSFTKTSTGLTISYHPFSSNISLTTFPIGLYLVTGNAYVQTRSNVSGVFNGVVSSVVSGIAIGTTQPSGNTARVQYFNSGALPELTNTSGIVKPISWAGVYNLTTTGQYITMYVGITCASTVTAGSIFGSLGAISVTKIA